VNFGEAVHWKLEAMARAFDPSLFVDTWPGALDFDLQSAGEWPKQGPSASFKLQKLAGKLRGRPINGSADVSLDRDLRPSGQASVRSGSTALEVTATAAPTSRVDASLRIGELQDWRRGFSGALSANVTSTGRWPDVAIRANAEANRVRGAALAFDAMKLSLDARDARAPGGTLAIEASGVKVAGFQFDTATIGLEGNERSHRLKLDARGEPLQLVSLETSGTLERKAWNGILEKLRLEVEKVPPLALRQPARLAVNRESMSLETTCLDGGEIAVCLAGKRSKA
jgi:translocation and assembly module TamB